MKALKVFGASILILLIFAVDYLAICVLKFAYYSENNLPRIEIDTDGVDIVSKEEYVKCTVSITETQEEYTIDKASAGIRGRGNDTWLYYPKKPYRIKFDEKTSLFGEEKNKSWVLLAMYNDYSLMKDRLAFGLAEALGADFSPSYNYVELYLNGRYKGVYLLTDQVDENDGRCGVKEKFAAEDTEVPFLVELDARAPEEGIEGVDWFKAGGYAYAIKYPEADERYTDEQFLYIEDYIKKCDALCRKEGVTLDELSRYIDVAAFIDYYLVEELMGQPEINEKSVFMSKSREGKLVMGPVWDFDWSMCGPYIGDYRLSFKDSYEGFRSSGNWFDALLKSSDEFRAALCARWSEVVETLWQTVEAVKAEQSLLRSCAIRDYTYWHFYDLTRSYDRAFSENMLWLEQRFLWLDAELLK